MILGTCVAKLNSNNGVKCGALLWTKNIDMRDKLSMVVDASDNFNEISSLMAVTIIKIGKEN